MDIKEILEKALQGRVVVLRNGRKGYVRHVEKAIETEYPVIGFMEMLDGSVGVAEWTLDGRCLTDGSECKADIAGLAPLEFDHWSVLDESFVAIVKSREGDWHGVTDVSIASEVERWVYYDYACRLVGFSGSIFPDCDWKDSLIVRPDSKDSE